MRTVNTGGLLPVAGAIALALALAASSPRALLAQAGTQGQWRTLANQTPINHSRLLINNASADRRRSVNPATEPSLAAVWDPLSQTFNQALAWTVSARWSCCPNGGCSSMAAT